MRLTAILALVLFLPAIVSKECFESLNWTTSNAQILVNGQPLVLKGIKYNGFETDIFAPHGLATRPLNDILDIIRDNGFNAIQLPFSMQLVRDNPNTKEVNCFVNSNICGTSTRTLTGTRMLDIFIERAAERGLLIVLSNKKFDGNGDTNPALWYDSNYSEDVVTRLWASLANRYKNQWNVFALDLKNQPNSEATWGDSSNGTDWNKASERMIKRLGDFNGLFFIDGIIGGVILTGAKNFPINTGNVTLNKRVVYTPHCYGPSIFNRSEFGNMDFPRNLKDLYAEEYGFLADQGHAVVIGDWGGKFEPDTADDSWHKWYVEWLKEKCLTNNIYWSLNPNIAVYGGLLKDDWKTPIQNKLDLVNELQPNATKFTVEEGKICITPGAFPDHCNGIRSSTQAPSSTTVEETKSTTAI